ncbi:hypothetical protein SLE2022_267500 [Rubroshorea leprosula]
MALKLPISFPIFVPPSLQTTFPCPYLNSPSHHRPTEIRFSRWNNANAEKFNERRRAQKEIEDDIRRYRRFDSANKIATLDHSAATSTIGNQNGRFKSLGTPSSPSKPSIPGKKSKYSKPPDPHPAVRKLSKTAIPPRRQPIDKEVNVTIAEDGVSYVIDGAPFEFKYSYTETPKVKPLKLREPYAPFGPTTMHRPWTGGAPLPPRKKKLKEFDSFVLPPPNKKGVKPVQKPGPFLPGSGPRYVKSREEILGEPLTEEEVKELVKSCMKSERQLNMGRDGLTHNMLDNIHAHWKRRRVCKIKCKGVCTVDMDNVCQQLEERTGGKIIYRRGGVLYLFRGRNYNYKTCPRFPLMLWKPATPVYPRLIQQVPEGLTLEEATEMQRKGRELMPICKLAKNGVYCDLVKNVREAFEECELVRINCQGIKGSDYHKIGAKLKDLVPCVLISFEHEHILIWRGRNWKSSLPKPEVNSWLQNESTADFATSVTTEMEGPEKSSSGNQTPITMNANLTIPTTSPPHVSSQEMFAEQIEDLSDIESDGPYASTCGDISYTDETVLDVTSYTDELKGMESTYGGVSTCGDSNFADDELEAMSKNYVGEKMLDNTGSVNKAPVVMPLESVPVPRSAESTVNELEPSDVGSINHKKLQYVAEASENGNRTTKLDTRCTEGVLLLLKQAVESGSAVVLDDASLDADKIYERTVVFARSAPPGPVFRRRPRKAAVKNSEKQEPDVLEVKEVAPIRKNSANEKQTSKIQRRKDIEERYLDVVPKGTLKIDELAKLLA